MYSDDRSVLRFISIDGHLILSTVITCNLEQGYKLEQTAISFELYHQMLSNLAHTMLH